jgi:hypothetical protein
MSIGIIKKKITTVHKALNCSRIYRYQIDLLVINFCSTKLALQLREVLPHSADFEVKQPLWFKKNSTNQILSPVPVAKHYHN